MGLNVREAVCDTEFTETDRKQLRSRALGVGVGFCCFVKPDGES